MSNATSSGLAMDRERAPEEGDGIPVTSGAATEPVVKVIEGCSIEPSISTEPSIVEDLGGGVCFVGRSPAMREILRLVELIAQTSVPVLIHGETGVGKEVIVKLIHARSLRADKPLLKVNCAALPADLLESELFGYEPGAFTGATKQKTGKFEACDKGTILLDEIAEMPPGPQAKLLQVLQDGEFSRLGSHNTIHVDVRLLAATNVDIPVAIAARKFREDVYYRLNAFSIEIPPLRQRKEDIPILIDYFSRLHSSGLGREPLPLSPALMHAALRYDWPGNARELENFVKRHLIVRDDAKAIAQLKASRHEPRHAESSPVAPKGADLKSYVRSLKQQAERQAIVAALQFASGNRKEAAGRLNISPRSLLYKIREYGIREADSRGTGVGLAS